MSYEEQKNRILKISYILQDVLKKIEEKIEPSIVSHKEALNLFGEIEMAVKKTLAKIFGNECIVDRNNWDGIDIDTGLTEPILNYDYGENKYSDAVLFSYWSLKGEPLDTTTDDESGIFRGNIFYKGRRWSPLKMKRRFYQIFDEIKEAVNGKALVDFVTRNGIKSNKNYIKIVSGIEESDDEGRITIRIPNEDDILNKFNSPELKDLVTRLRKLNDCLDEEDELNEYLGTIDFEEDIISKLKNGYEALVSSAADKQIIEKVRKQFESCLNLSFTNSEILDVILTYQFYDYPYDIHFFLPELEEEKSKKHLMSSLTITTVQDYEIPEDYRIAFNALVNILGKVPNIEEKVWKKQGEDLSIYWAWREFYDERINKFIRISYIIRNICSAISKNKNLHISFNPSGVKNFDSFYDKIVDRANGRVEVNKDGKEMDENGKKITSKAYKHHIRGRKIEDAKWIFNRIKDVARARVICVYKEDAGIFKDAFEDLCYKEKKDSVDEYDKKDFIRIDFENHDKIMGYQSYHIWFKLGKKREKIYEFEDLMDIICEIQIRTILEQAWADVSHDLSYKPAISHIYKKLIDEKIKGKLGKQQIKIEDVENQFMELRDEASLFMLQNGIDNSLPQK